MVNTIIANDIILPPTRVQTNIDANLVNIELIINSQSAARNGEIFEDLEYANPSNSNSNKSFVDYFLGFEHILLILTQRSETSSFNLFVPLLI